MILTFVVSINSESLTVPHIDGIINMSDLFQINDITYNNMVILPKSKIICAGEKNICEKSQVSNIGYFWNETIQNLDFSHSIVTTEGYTYTLNPELDCKSYKINNEILYEQSSCRIVTHPEFKQTFLACFIQFPLFYILFLFMYQLMEPILHFSNIKKRLYPLHRHLNEDNDEISFGNAVLGTAFLGSIIASVGSFDNNYN